MMSLYYYGICVLVIICVLITIYMVKIQRGFWYIQPVFHYYNFSYWLASPRIINPQLPSTNKYVNLKNIEIFDITKKDEPRIQQFIALVREHYMRTETSAFLPHDNDILSHFTGHLCTSYCCVYKKQDDNNIIGAITSRPVNGVISGINIEMYYIDYLCVDKLERGKNIAAQLIQTHEYMQRQLNPEIKVCLFKREEDLTSIVPLTVYTAQCYDCTELSNDKFTDNNNNIMNVSLTVTLDVTWTQSIQEFYTDDRIISKFITRIIPSLENINALIVSGNMYIYTITKNKKIVAIYVFKRPRVVFDEDKELIVCITSAYNDILISIDDFKWGFEQCINKPMFKPFNYLTIEAIGDNQIIINGLSGICLPKYVSTYAYYLYNYIHPSVSSNECFIIN